MKRVVFLLMMALSLGRGMNAVAGHAAFSTDGSVVYFSAERVDDLSAIGALSVETGAVTVHRLTGVGLSDDILGVAGLADGKILLLTETALWSWHPKTKALALLRHCPDGEKFRDLAAWSATGRVLVTSELDVPDESGRTERVSLADAPEGPFRNVWLRRLEHLTAPVFLSADTLLFGAEGDLWMGAVEPDSGGDTGPRFVLAAHRCAPLADRETYGGTPSQVGVSDLAVSQGKVYAHVSRMGGSGWGELIRLDLPKPLDGGLRERYAQYQAVLGSVEFLTDNGTRAFLCHSADGAQVYFTDGNHPDHRSYLVVNNADPAPVKRP